MKGFFLLIFLFVTVPLTAGTWLDESLAEAEKNQGIISGVPFTPLQLGIGFFDRWQLFDGEANSLFSFGVLGLAQRSSVVSFAPANKVKHNYFFQTGLVGKCEQNWGCAVFLLGTADDNICQIGLVNYIRKKNLGLQIAVFNLDSSFLEGKSHHSGFQFGLLNLGSKIQAGLLNVGTSDFQFGLFNADGNFQAGLLNAGTSGFQFGLFNADGNFQLGLLNYNRKGLFTWMPFFNFSRQGE